MHKIINNYSYLMAFIFCFAQKSYSQVSSPKVGFDSPYEVVYNHLDNLQKDTYYPDQSALSFPKDAKDPQNLAIQLKQILDGKGLYIDVNRIPKSNNYIDTLKNESIYVLDKTLPNIYLEKLEGRWQYSRTTASLIPQMHKSIFPFGTSYITKFNAPAWQFKFLGIKVWKWFGLAILLALAFILSRVIGFIARSFITGFVKKRIELTDDVKKSLLRLSHVLGYLVAIRFILFLIPTFQIAPKLNASIIKSLNVLSLFFVIISLKFVIKILFAYFKKITQKTENTLDDQLFPLLYKLALILLWAIGLIYILDYLGVNITALLAGLSIGGLALALAAQDTVKNFFGSIMIFLDKPFQIGDLVEFSSVTGTIEEVGIRSTRIRTPNNSLTYVPNAMIADSIVNNLGLRVFRRFNTNIGITYDSPPDHIEEFVSGIRNIIDLHPMTKKDNYEVHLNSFGDSSLNIFFNVFFETKIFSEELKFRHEIMIAIIRLAESMHIRFAFPSQTLYIESLPNLGSDTTPSPLQLEELMNRKKEGLQSIEQYFQSRNSQTNIS